MLTHYALTVFYLPSNRVCPSTGGSCRNLLDGRRDRYVRVEHSHHRGEAGSNAIHVWLTGYLQAPCSVYE